MELRAEVFAGGEHGAEFLVDGARLERAEADADVGSGLTDGEQELGQAAAIFPFPAPGGNFDAVDDDFAIAFLRELFRFLHGGLQRHGADAASGVGDDTVGAEAVAAVFDFEKRSCTRGKTAGGELLEGTGKAARFDLFPMGVAGFILRGLLHLQNEGFAVGRSDHHVDTEGTDLIRGGLRVAAADTDGCIGIQLLCAADGVACFLVGDSSDSAGIDDVAVAGLVEFAERVAMR